MLPYSSAEVLLHGIVVCSAGNECPIVAFASSCVHFVQVLLPPAGGGRLSHPVAQACTLTCLMFLQV